MATTNETAVVLAAKNDAIGKYCTKDDLRFIEDLEKKLGKIRSAIQSELRKIARLSRIIENTPEFLALQQAKKKAAHLKRMDDELSTKTCAIYDKALQDVAGETLSEKLQTIAEMK